MKSISEPMATGITGKVILHVMIISLHPLRHELCSDISSPLSHPPCLSRSSQDIVGTFLKCKSYIMLKYLSLLPFGRSPNWPQIPFSVPLGTVLTAVSDRKPWFRETCSLPALCLCFLPLSVMFSTLVLCLANVHPSSWPQMSSSNDKSSLRYSRHS
jgi:hypothetical protein